MSNPLLPIGTSEARSDAFRVSAASPATVCFLGSGAGVVQLRRIGSDGQEYDVPDGELSATNTVFVVHGDGEFILYRAATATACGAERG